MIDPEEMAFLSDMLGFSITQLNQHEDLVVILSTVFSLLCERIGDTDDTECSDVCKRAKRI